MDESIKRYIYDRITEELERVFGKYRYDGEGFRDHVREWQRSDLRDFRDWLDGVLDRSNYEVECLSEISTVTHNTVEKIESVVGYSRKFAKFAKLTWREIKVVPQKFKACVCCGRIFYDLSRNGRTNVCHYVTYEWWNQSRRRYQFRLKAGRPMSVCEVDRDDGKGGQNVHALGGQATSYSYTTRMRMERQMLVWTSFHPSNDAEEAFIRKIELSQSSHAINGRYKPAMVNATEWPAKGAHKPENYYANVKEVLEAEKQSGKVERFNLFDLTWDEIVHRGLDRYISEEKYYEKQRKTLKTA